MRTRLAAAAAGCILIAAVIVAFALRSHPVIAGTSGVEPIRPTVFLGGGNARQCQPLSRVPRGADRMRLLVTYLEGGARHLHVEVSDRRGPVAVGDLNPARIGEREIKLRPLTRPARGATLCLSNPGPGTIVVGGDAKKAKEGANGRRRPDKQGVASVAFLRPGSSSWFAQTGTIADRYANSQTGVTGGWSLWLAVLLAISAALLGLWSVVGWPERSA
jgi:hypothetical protein